MEDGTSALGRPQMYLFGCTLTSDKRESKVDVEDDDTEQQLSLKAVCLGADAEDKFHMVEVEGLTFDGKTTKVPLVALRPSVLPSMTLGGFEITPPVTFRLQAGSGPVHISGQHFVSVKESDDEEEENNTSPVKRPSSLMSGKKLPMKKLKMESDEEEDDSDDDDNDDDSNGNEAKPQKGSGKTLQRTPGPVKTKSPAGPSKSVSDVRLKLSAAAKEGKPLPKTEQKFENYVRSSFKISDKSVIKDLWSFVQTLKTEKK
ncbi:nucleophosmin-like isoform X3 [Salarias fasciatus]|uniref:nucleophosmin-like isoform X3 n=1 Tax=Salarias fasciatus TaxID=181472 RepID=UPI001176DBEB|nr:nucleophosmin-like isoform X3 [Salarias fasciatus]